MKKIVSIFMAIALSGMLLMGCGDTDTSTPTDQNIENTNEDVVIADDIVEDEGKEVDLEEESDLVEEIELDTTPITIGSLKGPTAMGMVKMMADHEVLEESYYDFVISSAIDEITPKLISGQLDLASVPANMAAVLYNNTEGEIQVVAVNTLGVLYIVENGESVTSIQDLEGKTIYASGKGGTPEYALNYILEQNGLLDTVTIEWKSEHAECVAAIATTEGAIAMLPEPFVTTARMANEDIQVVLDLTQEWNDLGVDSELLTGVLVGRREFLEANETAMSQFLAFYESSTLYANEHVEEAAALIGQYEIVTEAVALQALPKCNITFIASNEMKAVFSGYLEVLFDQNPASVGGTLPRDDFYYNAN